MSDQPLVEPDPRVEPVETTPLLRVVKGDLTPEELAALVAVVAARNAAASAETKVAVRSQWGHPARAARPVIHHGPDGWRTAVLGR
ncbi:MAG: hypothetical protein JWP10_1375 [Nocardioidaceae bacterium]|nr:hypothetical protein [Nocardioidaceae bacterium]